MMGISPPQIKNPEPLKPSTQVTNEEIFEKEEHNAIYDAFIQSLENKAQPEGLKKDDETVLAFMLQNQTIFKNLKPEDIKPLSEDNFCQFLLSVFKKIREKNLASEENLKNGEIKKAVDDCVADIRETETKDSLIKLTGWPFGIKVDPKNISGSFMSGIKDKIPFLGKDKKEEDEPPLSDEQMVTTFLRSSLLPLMLFTFATLTFSTGPIMLGIAIIGLVITEAKTVKSLFSNDRKGTLYNPHSQEDEKKKGQWNRKILEGIDNILGTGVESKEVKESTAVPEKIAQGNKNGEEPHSKVEQPAAVQLREHITGRTAS